MGEVLGDIPPPTTREKMAFGYIYLVEAVAGLFKIGTSKNVHARVAQLQTASPVQIMLRHHFPAADARNVERELHRRFESRRVRSEWFQLAEADVAAICEIRER